MDFARDWRPAVVVVVVVVVVRGRARLAWTSRRERRRGGDEPGDVYEGDVPLARNLGFVFVAR
jgi:hypothetical protein